VFKSGTMDTARHNETLSALGARLDNAMQAAPIAYRSQNRGDYLIPALTLKPELSADRIGFALHRSDENASDLAAEAAAPMRHLYPRLTGRR
jgi:NAD(P)H dehydrogenase (quinone)